MTTIFLSWVTHLAANKEVRRSIPYLGLSQSPLLNLQTYIKMRLKGYYKRFNSHDYDNRFCCGVTHFAINQ